MSDERYVHVNGEVVPESEATVSVRDRGFAYGDAVFETLRAYGGEVFEWEAHAERLAGSCAALGIDHGLSEADLRPRIDETLSANGFDEAYVKLSITRGVQPGKLTPKPVSDPTVVVIAAELPRGGPDGDPVWDGPASATIADVRRVPDACLPARAKTHNYLNGILARREALAAGTDEAITLDLAGNLAEGATCNLFFVRDETLCTPSLSGPILPGITRRVVLELAGEEGIPVEEATYRPDDLLTADEAFLTNTTWEVRPLVRVDDRVVERGPITERLREAFSERIAAHYETVD
ncbi:aminotransferase class IV [Natronorarus salvus]|uniref:aminotransferase class IV n=1 Tax=Natronorarus salvus TaxID=3117733 RepID=UPI002F26401A